MSAKFIELTVMGDKMMLNIDCIETFSAGRDGTTDIFSTEPEGDEKTPWNVDESYEEMKSLLPGYQVRL